MGLANAYGVPLLKCPENKPGPWMAVDELEDLASSRPLQTCHELVLGI